MKKTCLLASLLLTLLASCNMQGHRLYADGDELEAEQPVKTLQDLLLEEGLGGAQVTEKMGMPSEELLREAAAKGWLPVVKKLLEKGIAVDSKTKFGTTPLHSAALQGHTEIVQILLDKGAEVNSTYDLSPLYGRITFLKMSGGGTTPLHNAARNGHTEIAQILLGKGAEVNSKDKSSHTPLHRATWNGHTETVCLLLKHGADMNSAIKHGHTPLMLFFLSPYKAVKGNIPLLKALINAPQNFHLKNHKEQTALEIAEERLKEAELADKKFYSTAIALLKLKMES